MSSVESPCIKVCVLDERQVCIGCLRTLDEIAAWERMDTATRRAVVARVTLERARRERAGAQG